MNNTGLPFSVSIAGVLGTALLLLVAAVGLSSTHLPDPSLRPATAAYLQQARAGLYYPEEKVAFDNCLTQQKHLKSLGTTLPQYIVQLCVDSVKPARS